MLTVTYKTIDDSELNLFLIDSETTLALEDADISEKDFSELLYSASEQADWDIDTLLSEIQRIEDYDLRNLFRRFLISQKYNILARYPRGGTKEYAITFVNDECVLVDCPRVIIDDELIKPTSTIVLSPTGEIKVPEGEVYINGNSITIHGFNASWNGLQGLYGRRGEMLLPCIFEMVTNNDYENDHYARYKGIYYRFSPVPAYLDDLEDYTGFEGNIYYNGQVAYEKALLYGLPSFLSETKEYKLEEKAFISLAEKNEEELWDDLNNATKTKK